MAKKYEDQMDIFEEGGLKDEGGSVDPVSGNDVPSGSTQKEVRDDIPAQLSEGEFVLPADVVRYIGLENIMKMRDMAKEGLQKMEDMGQMGNSEEATISDTTDFDDDIDKFIDELDQEEEEGDDRQEFQVGGLAGMTPQTPGVQTPATGFLPPGVTVPGTDTTLPEAPVVQPGGTLPGVPTYETKQYIGPNGEIRSFTFINGEPVVPIPEGFKEYDPTTVPETQTGVPTAQVTGDGGGDGPEDQTVNVDPVIGTARALARLNPESKTAKAVDQYNSSMLKTGVSAAASVLSGNLAGLALSAYRGYKANKELKDTVGTTLAQNNPTLSAVLSETGNITSMSESDVADSIESGINMGMSPGLAAAITASGGKIQTGPAVTEVDINTGQQSTRQGQTSISGLAGNAETAVQEMYGQSLAQSNPTAYRDMVEEAAFYDATGYGVMSNVTSPVSSAARAPSAPTAPRADAMFDYALAEEESRSGLTSAPPGLSIRGVEPEAARLSYSSREVADFANQNGITYQQAEAILSEKTQPQRSSITQQTLDAARRDAEGGPGGRVSGTNESGDSFSRSTTSGGTEVTTTTSTNSRGETRSSSFIDSNNDGQKNSNERGVVTSSDGTPVTSRDGTAVTSRSSDEVGGGSSNEKIVCTAMNDAYGLGSFRQSVWLKHSAELDPAYQKGYHRIFKPLVSYAYRSDKIGHKKLRSVLEHIARHRTADIWKQRHGKRDLIGAVERAVLEPLCYIVGKIK